MATRNHIRLKSWDRASLNLPFGPGAAVVGEPVRVARDVDEEGLEAARALLQQRLDDVTHRAEALARREAAHGTGADGAGAA